MKTVANLKFFFFLTLTKLQTSKLTISLGNNRKRNRYLWAAFNNQMFTYTNMNIYKRYDKRLASATYILSILHKIITILIDF